MSRRLRPAPSPRLPRGARPRSRSRRSSSGTGRGRRGARASGDPRGALRNPPSPLRSDPSGKRCRRGAGRWWAPVPGSAPRTPRWRRGRPWRGRGDASRTRTTPGSGGGRPGRGRVRRRARGSPRPFGSPPNRRTRARDRCSGWRRSADGASRSRPPPLSAPRWRSLRRSRRGSDRWRRPAHRRPRRQHRFRRRSGSSWGPGCRPGPCRAPSRPRWRIRRRRAPSR